MADDDGELDACGDADAVTVGVTSGEAEDDPDGSTEGVGDTVPPGVSDTVGEPDGVESLDAEEDAVTEPVGV